MNQTGMKHLLSSKFTLGADATAAAGPVGRAATAQTDATMHAEMLSYSRARGIFAGIVLDGATLRPDDSANKELYGADPGNRTILTGSVTPPPAAAKLEATLNRQSMRKSR
jgi:lipid-binding SYLF domain-containing protein